MQVLLGGDHLALLTRDGSLFTWGSGLEGQLGVSKLGTCVPPVRHVCRLRALVVILGQVRDSTPNRTAAALQCC